MKRRRKDKSMMMIKLKTIPNKIKSNSLSIYYSILNYSTSL